MRVPPVSWIAFTREVSASIVDCELTHIAREPIHVDVARAQHGEYERLLVSLGCSVRRVDAAPDCPDAVFVEDTAVVLDEVAVIARPGAPSRRAELAPVEQSLTGLRETIQMTSPATMDGGDVMVVGRTVFVGLSSRTNTDGAAQMRAALAPFGYIVRTVPVSGCLHLKSAVTSLDDSTVLLNPEWVDPGIFDEYRVVEVDSSEPMAANVLRVGRELVYGTVFPRTLARLTELGVSPHLVDVSELAKAEGAVTCCCLLLRQAG